MDYGDSWTESVDVPALDEPPPSQWRTIEDDFLMVYAVRFCFYTFWSTPSFQVSLSHISNINVYAPNALPNEQKIHLTYVLKRDLKSKAELAKFLTAIETKKHLDFPFCHYLTVQAFRLDTNSKANNRQGPIVVDGEIIPENCVQAVVSDVCMRVVSK
jgi:hypothetical protein